MNDMRNLWQNQETEPVKMPVEQIRKRAQAFQRKIRLRNSIEYAGVVFIVVAFGFMLRGVRDPILRAGDIVCMAGALYVAYQLHRRGSSRTPPADVTCLEFHRGELQRQRELHRNVWSWYLAPLVPGLATIILAALMAQPGRLPHPRLIIAAYTSVCALLFLVIWKLNGRAAEKLQRRIEELDAFERQ